MTIDPSSQLLARLAFGRAGAVAPLAGPQASPQGASGIAPGDFASLLAQAQSGTLRSGAPVTVAPDANLTLSDDQLAKLSIAADKAEAAGVRTALVLMGDQQFVLDVAAREIVGLADASAGVVANVDGVINLNAQPAGAPPALPLPGALPANPSLLEALARRESASERRSA
jgi:hypothetical protein